MKNPFRSLLGGLAALAVAVLMVPSFAAAAPPDPIHELQRKMTETPTIGDCLQYAAVTTVIFEARDEADIVFAPVTNAHAGFGSSVLLIETKASNLALSGREVRSPAIKA